MDGTAELLQLAHLLRVGANTAREIATLRKFQSGDINSLADQAEVMADSIEKITRAPMPEAEPRLVKSGGH